MADFENAFASFFETIGGGLPQVRADKRRQGELEREELIRQRAADQAFENKKALQELVFGNSAQAATTAFDRSGQRVIESFDRQQQADIDAATRLEGAKIRTEGRAKKTKADEDAQALAEEFGFATPVVSGFDTPFGRFPGIGTRGADAFSDFLGLNLTPEDREAILLSQATRGLREAQTVDELAQAEARKSSGQFVVKSPSLSRFNKIVDEVDREGIDRNRRVQEQSFAVVKSEILSEIQAGRQVPGDFISEVDRFADKINVRRILKDEGLTDFRQNLRDLASDLRVFNRSGALSSYATGILVGDLNIHSKRDRSLEEQPQEDDLDRRLRELDEEEARLIGG